MSLELGPNEGYLITGLLIAGITFAIEKWVLSLGVFGRLLYGAAAILVIVWAVTLLLTVL